MPVCIRRVSLASGVPVAGLAEMGMIDAEKEGQTGFPFFTWVRVEASGPRTCRKIAVDSRINGQGIARELH